MFTTWDKRGAVSFELTPDEQEIVLFVRTLQIDREEAVRRLATVPLPPVLPGGQELQSNLSAIARDPLDVAEGNESGPS
jgi:hypothetical protein